MENYKHETKYNIGDNVFAIRYHHPDAITNNKKIEFYEIYCAEIKNINIDYFGIKYKIEKIHEFFGVEDVFLQTDKQGLYERLSEIMEKEGNE